VVVSLGVRGRARIRIRVRVRVRVRTFGDVALRRLRGRFLFYSESRRLRRRFEFPRVTVRVTIRDRVRVTIRDMVRVVVLAASSTAMATRVSIISFQIET